VAVEIEHFLCTNKRIITISNPKEYSEAARQAETGFRRRAGPFSQKGTGRNSIPHLS
jgi:hypothetical protein